MAKVLRLTICRKWVMEMCKLMRAEWYRFRHSAGFFKIFLAFCLMIFFVATLNVDWDKSTMADTVPTLLALTENVMAMFIGTIICAAISSMFSNRTAYYEVMDGNSTTSIILSKVLVYTGSVVVFFLLPNIILLAVVGIKNGTGGVYNYPLIFLMYLITIVHIISTEVMHVYIFKNMFAAVFPYLRFVCFEVVGSTAIPMAAKSLFGLSDSTIEKMNEVFSWLPCNQLIAIGDGNDSNLLIKIIIGFVVEFALVFAIAYKSMKRKNFKK